jgi:hypothetical protein
MSERAKYGEVYVHGIVGAISFSQRQPWGQNGQAHEVQIDVPTAALKRIAPFLDCEYGSHAVWHADNPQRPFPCQGDDLNPPCNVSRVVWEQQRNASWSVWFEGAVAAAVDDAMKKLFADPMTGLFLYFKPGGLVFAPDLPGPEWELGNYEPQRGSKTREQMMAWTRALARRLPCLPADRR